MNNLALIYLDTDRLNDATALFEEAVKRQRTKSGGLDKPRTLSTMNNLAAAYLAAKRWTDADKTARACLAHEKSHCPTTGGATKYYEPARPPPPSRDLAKQAKRNHYSFRL